MRVTVAMIVVLMLWVIFMARRLLGFRLGEKGATHWDEGRD